MNPKHIVSIGDLVVDMILSIKLPVQANQYQMADTITIEPGGAGNFIMTASNLGLDVSAIGVVGSDIFGQQIMSIFDEKGINTQGLIIPPDSTTTTVLALADTIKNEHVFIGSYGKNLYAEPTRYTQEIIMNADAIFIAGYTLVEEYCDSILRYSVELASRDNIPIYLDVGPFFKQVSPEKHAWILQHATALLMTKEEVPSIANRKSGAEAYRWLLSHQPELLIVKDGANGCQLISTEQNIQVNGFPVKVVDTIGAGDCFAAGFIFGHLHNYSNLQSAQLANAVGAVSVQKVGAGRNAPTCAEIKRLLGTHAIYLELPC